MWEGSGPPRGEMEGARGWCNHNFLWFYNIKFFSLTNVRPFVITLLFLLAHRFTSSLIYINRVAFKRQLLLLF